MEVLTYIEKATKSYQKIYLERDGRLWLLKFNGVVKTAVVAMMDESLNGPCQQVGYKVITGYPLERLPDFAKREATLVWERGKSG